MEIPRMYQAISCIFVSRTKLALTCLSLTSLLVQVVGVPRSVFFWCPECCAQFRSLVHLRNPGYARDTDEGFALVARFLHDSRLVERNAAEFAQEQPSTEYRRRPRVRYIATKRVGL